MDFGSFVEGPILWVVFVSFLLCMMTRLACFLYAVILSVKRREKRLIYTFSILSRVLLPYHKGILRKPAYSALRYIFHICLFAVPIGLSAHVVLWEESRFGWNWPSLPDPLADWMTLLLLFITAFFLVRRILLPGVRRHTSKSNYVLITTVALPFLTGYILAHGGLDSIPFMADNIRTIHVITSEAMLVTIMFLFYRTELLPENCTGCASCALACPTKSLASEDQGVSREFSYHHYQCIGCGACAGACPEDAAELIHEIRPRRLFQIRFRETIRSIPLFVCKQCGTLYAPDPQLRKTATTIREDFIYLCPQCRMVNYGEKMRRTFHGRKSRMAGSPP